MSSAFLDTVRLDGQRLDANVTGSILSAKLIRTYDAATRVELELSDPYGEILRSGLVVKRGRPPVQKKPRRTAKPITHFDTASWARVGRTRLTLDGIRFLLAGLSFDYGATGRLTLIFEDEVAMKLRRYKRRVVAVRRRSSTRARFELRLAQIAGVAWDVPERDDVQPVQGATPRERARLRRKGISRVEAEDLLVKDVPVNDDQVKHLESALAVADEEEKAGELATVAMIVAAIGESTVANVVNSLGYGGVFQGQVAKPGGTNWFAPMGPFERTAEQAESFLRGGRGFQQGGAIHLANRFPDMSPGEIATRVEASGKPADFYDVYQDEAQAILAAWGGAGRVVVDREEREFINRKGTSFWRTGADLASEVRARHFATENVLHYVSDDYLIGLQPVFAVGRDKDGELLTGVRRISGTAHVGLPFDELVVELFKPRWTGRAGIPVTVRGMGPIDGRWLGARYEEDLFELEPAIVTLRRPVPLLKEPAPQTSTRTVPAGEITTAGGAKGIVDQVADLMISVGGEGVYVVSAYREGDPLDHGSNDADRAARDIAVRGVDALRGPPHPKLDKGVAALGEILDRDWGDGDETVIDTWNWEGFRLQALWRTPLYGPPGVPGHMGHLHFGARRL